VKTRGSFYTASVELTHSARPSGNDRYLRIPAEDPRRFGSDSGHLIADPIGYDVMFSPLGVPESLKSSARRVREGASGLNGSPGRNFGSPYQRPVGPDFC
jgi:hypothetical protein